MMISLVYITLNEEKYIGRSISSIASIATEVIVFDHFSSDNTVEICKSLGAKVFQGEWAHDFSKSRNKACAYCSEPWILSVDADEHLEGENLNLITEAIAISEEASILAWSFVRKNHYPSHDSDSPFFRHPFYPDPQVRLFMNVENIYYSGAVHEGVQQSIEQGGGGGIGRLSICLHHHMFRGDKDKFEREKGQYYRKIAEGDFV